MRLTSFRVDGRNTFGIVRDDGVIVPPRNVVSSVPRLMFVEGRASNSADHRSDRSGASARARASSRSRSGPSAAAAASVRIRRAASCAWPASTMQRAIRS